MKPASAVNTQTIRVCDMNRDETQLRTLERQLREIERALRQYVLPAHILHDLINVKIPDLKNKVAALKRDGCAT